MLHPVEPEGERQVVLLGSCGSVNTRRGGRQGCKHGRGGCLWKKRELEGVLLLLPFTPGVFLDISVGVGIPLSVSGAGEWLRSIERNGAKPDRVAAALCVSN